MDYVVVFAGGMLLGLVLGMIRRGGVDIDRLIEHRVPRGEQKGDSP